VVFYWQNENKRQRRPVVLQSFLLAFSRGAYLLLQLNLAMNQLGFTEKDENSLSGLEKQLKI
jgi:hypothetical protein